MTSRNQAETALRALDFLLDRVAETQAEIAGSDLELSAVAHLVAERARELTDAEGIDVTVLDGDEQVLRAQSGSAGTTHQLSVPLVHGKRSVGALAIAKVKGVSGHDRRVLELLAILLCSAMSDARVAVARRRETEALDRFETIFESAPIGIALVSLDGKLRTTNPAMRDITGRSAEELANRSTLEYTVPEDIDELVQLFGGMVKGKHDSYRHELRLYAKTGEVVWVDTATTLLRDPDGKPLGAVSMAQNITERRAAEEQLRQSQKIEAIGHLTAGIAHDFNNLLFGVLGYIELAQARIEADGPVAEYLRRAALTAQRAATLTGQLLAFGRRQKLDPQPLELNTLVAETAVMLASLLGEQIELVTDLDSDVHTVQADAGQMQQVLINLALNARDAMASGGTLTIRTRNHAMTARDIHSRGLEPGRYVALSVEDEGCGMTQEIRDQVFDPFFTTKGVGKGTGLGLSSAHGIVKQSGGHIEVDSELERGSMFTSYLPAIADAAVPRVESIAASPGVHRSPRGAGQRMLVVEDEEIVRTMLADTLRRLGYSVETAAGPSVALAMLSESRNEFALVLTDMVMPHMTGAELARQVASWKPELPFLFMSGYTEDVVTASETGTASLLRKPFTTETLAKAVRDALELADAA